MNNKLLLAIATVISFMATATTVVAAPLPNGTKLTIEKTTDAPFVGPVPGCTNGSCFGMFMFSGLFAWIPLGPGTDGGLIIGKGQKSGGQEIDPLSLNSGELTEAWVFAGYNGTFFTSPSDAGNVFDDQSCTGSGCGSNTTPRKTDLAVWNMAFGSQFGGVTVSLGSAVGCNKMLFSSCTANQVAGIFVKSWTIDPVGTVPRKYRLTYNQIPTTVFPNYPFELVLAGEVITKTVTPPPTLTIDGFWPGTASPGQFVFIFGQGFVPNQTKVQINGIPASFFVQVADPTLLFLMLPTGDTQGPITITTPNGSVTSSRNFNEPLTGVNVTGIWPSIVSPGQLVFVFGSGFVTNATTAAVNSIKAPILQVLEPTLLFFMAPPTPTTGYVSITTSAGTATSASLLTIK